MECKKTGSAKTILFGLTGTGYFDMQAYASYLVGDMTNYIPSDQELAEGFKTLPKV
jgi:tryptophan synthase beta chain